MRHKVSTWTKESCLVEAQKYSKRTDFLVQSSSAYRYAKKEGILEFCCSHMKGKLPEIDGKVWTIELCLFEASKYENKADFELGSPGAYEYAKRKQLIRKCVQQMKPASKPEVVWTKELCIKAAQPYTTPTAFGRYNRPAFEFARQNDFLVECYEHMPKRKKPKGVKVWTKDRCVAEALKYENRTDFQKFSPSAYFAASKNNWMVECSEHMAILKTKCEFTQQKLIEIANQFATRVEFRKGNPSAYYFAYRNKLMKTIFPVENRSKKNMLDLMLKAGSLESFKQKYTALYLTCIKLNWLDEILKAFRVRTTLDKYDCIKIASEYATELNFRAGANEVYELAKDMGWLHECTRDMVKSKIKWTKERCLAEASKFKSRHHFQSISPSAYQRAYTQNWLDECVFTQ